MNYRTPSDVLADMQKEVASLPLHRQIKIQFNLDTLMHAARGDQDFCCAIAMASFQISAELEEQAATAGHAHAE